MGEFRFRVLWESYSAKVIPANAGPVQVQETRRAFYAGGAALFGAVVTMLDPGTEPTEADLQKMTDLQNEFNAYLVELAEGKA